MNTKTESSVTLVEKEEIADYTFPKSEVLDSDLKKNKRDSQIKKAMKLGNNHKGKVLIIFQDSEGLKKVKTTIWGVTEGYIILKKTTTIPIRCIHDIKFY